MVLTHGLTPGGVSDRLASMAHKLRIEHSGAVDPVMNRGDGRTAIFPAEWDCPLLLQTPAEAGTTLAPALRAETTRPQA
jgi:hypothetical protein